MSQIRKTYTEQSEQSTATREKIINSLTSRIRDSLELHEILETTVTEIRSFLATDRVKIYHFLPDGSGEVIAEARNGENLPSLLGLRFPASDIPPPAREMLTQARPRVIVDVTSKQKIVEKLTVVGEQNQDDIRYSPVDECHIQYLTAMGVASSLSIPILHQNQLWGLLVSHHSQSQHFKEIDLEIIQLLADQVSIAIAQSNLLAKAQRQANYEATINHISRLLHSPLNISTIRYRVLEETVKVINCLGGRLYINPDSTGKAAEIYHIGKDFFKDLILEETPFWQEIICNHEGYSTENKPIFSPFTPRDSEINEPIGLIQSFKIYSIADLYKEEKLSYLYNIFGENKLRSLLIIPLQYAQQCIGCITLFRQEISIETLWAGYQPDQRNLRPRNSFAQWREIKQDQGQEWREDEINLAQAIANHLYMAVMQKRVEEMIRHQAYHDLLTGLPNRLLLNDRLSLFLANNNQSGEMLAVVFLDLDGFKNINETLGHAVGDELLKTVAVRLQKSLRKTDIIARWGGDEFTLLLSPVNSNQEVVKVCQRILDSLQVPINYNQEELYLKASLGVAIAPYDGQDSETLLKNADAAMFLAKQKGRNNYQLYNAALGNKVQQRMSLENDLYKALAREEFLLYYEPQVDIKNSKIIGFEALIRWRKSSGELVSPMEFIPLAEETGLICPIGEWVLKTACEQSKMWQKLGLPPLRVSVNISPRQFQEKNLIDIIDQVLAQTNLDPKYLQVEITESVTMQNIKYAISVLNALQDRGIFVAMDDFGTGYSSLNSLKTLPLDCLKIDKSFINDVEDAKEHGIIKAIIELGHCLDLQIVAEGVETPTQLQVLNAMGCDIFQGYFFSKPVPSEQITQLLTHLKLTHFKFD
jgi:diguanylate cyclase (GGDEF)-like protein